MIKPALQDDLLLDDIQSANQDDGHFRLWWLGQSGFLLQFRGSHLLLDPYLSDSLTSKYANTATPHVRMTERVIEPRRLAFVEGVTSSHAHTDHMDAETLVSIFQPNPRATFVCPMASLGIARERLAPTNVSIRPLDDGESLLLSRFRITAVASAHEGLERSRAGHMRYLGYVAEFGSWAVYHSGDTVVYPGLIERLSPFRVTVALLPINGRGRGVAGNLDAREAAVLAKQIGARMAIPCHYDMFAFNTADPQAFAEAAREEGQPFHVLQCGSRWSSASLP